LQSQFKKGISIFSILIFLIYGHYTVGYAQAASFNGNVKECMENPKKCENQKQGEDRSTKQTEGKSVVQGSSVVTIGDIVKMIFALIFVIALLYVLLKFINKRSRSYQNNRLIQNFGGTPLGGNKSLQIVKAGKRILILGVGEDIHLVKEIADEEEVRDFVDQYNQKLEQTMEPRDWVSKAVNVWKKRHQNRQAASSFGKLLKTQINTMKKDRSMVMKELEQKGKQRDE
jgi:flagellar protein FliO/FliZ